MGSDDIFNVDIGPESFPLSEMAELRNTIKDTYAYSKQQQRLLPTPDQYKILKSKCRKEGLKAPNIDGFPLKIYSPAEAAAILGLSSAHALHSWRRRGKPYLPYIQMGNEIRYSEVDLLEFLNTHRILPVDRPKRKG